MKLRSLEEFNKSRYLSVDDNELVNINPIVMSPHNYFTIFNGLRCLNIGNANLVLSRIDFEKLFEPFSNFNYVEYAPDLKQFVSYNQVYKSKSHDYFVVIDIEIDDVDDETFYSYDEVQIAFLYYNNTNTNLCNKMMEELNKLFELCVSKPDPYISIVLKTMAGFSFKKRKVKPYSVDISKNYNDDFIEEYDKIVNNLKNESKGIVLFHGLAGTGKTNLIRHLISSVPKKEFVFIPVSMVPHLTDPTFLSQLMDRKDLVLVLEDSEVFLKDRNVSGENSVVSTILNLSDGLLSDALSLQIICTFNADLDNIDEALMREGRLISEYKFDKLSLEKTKVIANELGFEIEKPMTLAEIYNYNNSPHRSKNKKKEIGFGKS